MLLLAVVTLPRKNNVLLESFHDACSELSIDNAPEMESIVTSSSHGSIFFIMALYFLCLYVVVFGALSLAQFPSVTMRFRYRFFANIKV